MFKISIKNALAENNLNLLKLFIEKGKNNVNTKNKNGKTPLHLAIENDCEEDIIRYLIQNGANLDVKDTYDLVPLHYAAERANVKAVELLIEHGANINPSNNNDYTPICAAVQSTRYNVDVINVLFAHCWTDATLGEMDRKTNSRDC